MRFFIGLDFQWRGRARSIWTLAGSTKDDGHQRQDLHRENAAGANVKIPRDLPSDDPKRFDLLQSFGIEGPEIELCRRKGCPVVFTAQGGISSVGPVTAGDRQYTLDPATEKWKVKE